MKTIWMTALLLLLFLASSFGDSSIIDEIVIPDPVELSLTVDQAVDLALQNNLTLVQEEAKLDGTKRTRDTAWNVFVPTVTAAANITRFKDGAPLDDTETQNLALPVQDSNGNVIGYDALRLPGEVYGTLGGSLDFQVVLTPQLWYGYKATVLNYEAGLLSIEKARSDLTTNIKKQFYGLIIQQERIKILETQLEAIEKRYQQTLDNYSFGLVDEYTTLSVRVNLESFKPGLEASRFGYRQALMAFKLSLGVSLNSDITLDGDISIDPQTYEAASLVSEYASNRNDIRQLLKTIAVLENSKGVQMAGFLPRIILAYKLSTAFERDPWADNWFDSSNWDEGQQNGVFSLILNLQLSDYLPFSTAMNNIKGSDEALRQTRAGLTMAYQAAQMEIISTVERLNNSVLTIKAKELNVDLAERAYNLAEESYNAGGKSLLDVEDAEDALQDARFQLLNEKFNYITAFLELEAAINAPLD